MSTKPPGFILISFQRLLIVVILTITVGKTFAQPGTYILNGSATQNSCNCYTLTEAVQFQNGSVWNANKISLEDPFDFTFNINLGCPDDGADGMVFILQPISTSIGNSGEGMGFDGIVPSIGISVDTYQNLNRNDPPYDHLSIQSMGRVTHDANDLVPVVQASGFLPDIEDCKWHTLRIVWDPAAQLLAVFFDGSYRQQANVDLIGTIFNNDPMVYWGFSAATGGSVNKHQFCTALNPAFNVDILNDRTCVGTPITFLNTSQSFTAISNVFWDLGDNTTTTSVVPPPHTYANPGEYEVKLAITGMDGCRSDTLKRIISVGDFPTAAFNVYDTCEGSQPRLVDESTLTIGNLISWEWILNGSALPNTQNPVLPELAVGNHEIQLTVKSDHGCSSSNTASEQLVIKAVPKITIEVENGCVDIPIIFTGDQIDNATSITSWQWDFGGEGSGIGQVANQSFDEVGSYNVILSANATNGCTGTATTTVFISRAFANAGRDTLILKDVPFQLNGSGGGIYNWSPTTGLNNWEIANPVTILQDDITYTLTVTTNEGCVDSDQIKIEVFKGSYVFVPTAFTPDGNGLNDLFIPGYQGIKQLDYFSVFNRWGERIFFSKNVSAGWDGTYKAKPVEPGVYVWMIRAIDYVGKVYEQKGTVTVIR